MMRHHLEQTHATTACTCRPCMLPSRRSTAATATAWPRWSSRSRWAGVRRSPRRTSTRQRLRSPPGWARSPTRTCLDGCASATSPAAELGTVVGELGVLRARLPADPRAAARQGAVAGAVRPAGRESTSGSRCSVGRTSGSKARPGGEVSVVGAGRRTGRAADPAPPAGRLRPHRGRSSSARSGRKTRCSCGPAGPRSTSDVGTYDSFWVRLVDLPEALQQRTWSAPCDVVVEVTDTDAPVERRALADPGRRGRTGNGRAVDRWSRTCACRCRRWGRRTWAGATCSRCTGRGWWPRSGQAQSPSLWRAMRTDVDADSGLDVLTRCTSQVRRISRKPVDLRGGLDAQSLSSDQRLRVLALSQRSPSRSRSHSPGPRWRRRSPERLKRDLIAETPPIPTRSAGWPPRTRSGPGRAPTSSYGGRRRGPPRGAERATTPSEGSKSDDLLRGDRGDDVLRGHERAGPVEGGSTATTSCTAGRAAGSDDDSMFGGTGDDRRLRSGRR